LSLVVFGFAFVSPAPTGAQRFLHIPKKHRSTRSAKLAVFSMNTSFDYSLLAIILPSSPSQHNKMTPGERRLIARLMTKLENDYICWYDGV